MEDLNKNQIVLLTLLVSFVTSIATGIMTVSLLQEAPLEVTRNINRIVEKTIETVTPATILTPSQKEVTTVVVKEEDLIIDSINKNIKSVVRIKEKDGAVGTVSLYGMGLVVTKDGIIAADRKIITELNTFSVVMNDDKEFPLVPMGKDKQTNFILFKAGEANKTTDKPADKTPYVFVPATFSDTEAKLGQTLIALGGDTSNSVAVGRVVALQMKDSTVGSTTTKSLISIDTDIISKDLIAGSPIFNLSGNVVGVKLSNDPAKSFTPISVLKKEMVTLIETVKVP